MGAGVVGGGVAEILAEKRGDYARQLGRPLVLTRALVRDPRKPRPAVLAGLVTTDADDVLEDPDVDIVVEVMGGEQPALDYIGRALAAGKYVVTANKEVMAKHGSRLLALAAAKDVDVLFEASVGGGIPIIAPLKRDLLANRILAVSAIINGTTNYILTRMAQDGTEFSAALAEAQKLGYAEADPSNDVDGHDSAYKLAILATLAFGTPVFPDQIFREGIRNVAPVDFDYVAELGYTLKLLAIAKREGDAFEARVHPALVTRGFLISQVSGVENAVRIKGDLVGHAVFAGRGAGAGPTSSAIVADLLDLAHNIHAGVHARVPVRFDSALKFRPMSEVVSRYFFRLWVADRAGVLAKIGQVCADTGVSMAAIVQKETDPSAGTAEIVILTHRAREGAMQEALARIAALDVVDRVASFLRVEDLEDS